MNREVRCIDIENIEVRESEKGNKITGYALKWNKLSEEMQGFREKFDKGAFSESISKNNVLAFWNHNRDVILGSTRAKTLSLTEDQKGLKFDIEMPDTTAANDLRKLIKRGDVKGVSFGFMSNVEEWDTDTEPYTRTIKKAELFEISPTHSPAYPQTWVSARNKDENNENPLEIYLKNEAEKNNKITNRANRSNKIRKNLLKNKGVI